MITVDSHEISRILGIRHDLLIRKTRTCIKNLSPSDSDFFIKNNHIVFETYIYKKNKKGIKIFYSDLGLELLNTRLYPEEYYKIKNEISSRFIHMSRNFNKINSAIIAKKLKVTATIFNKLVETLNAELSLTKKAKPIKKIGSFYLLSKKELSLIKPLISNKYLFDSIIEEHDLYLKLLKQNSNVEESSSEKEIKSEKIKYLFDNTNPEEKEILEKQEIKNNISLIFEQLSNITMDVEQLKEAIKYLQQNNSKILNEDMYKKEKERKNCFQIVQKIATEHYNKDYKFVWDNIYKHMETAGFNIQSNSKSKIDVIFSDDKTLEYFIEYIKNIASNHNIKY